MPSQPLDVLGVAEAAEALGVSRVSVSRMIQRGRLEPDARLACGPVFRRSTIDQLRKAREAWKQNTHPRY